MDTIRIIVISRESDIVRRDKLDSSLREHIKPADYEYFNAIEPSYGRNPLTRGETGCFLSHIRAIESTIGEHAALILEDDAVPHPDLFEFLEAVISTMRRKGEHICFLNTIPDLLNVASMKSFFSILRDEMDAIPRYVSLPAIRYCNWGCGAYIISGGSQKMVADLLRAKFEQDAPDPVDLVMSSLIADGQIRAGLIYPFLVGLDSDAASTITGRKFDEIRKFQNALTNLFVNQERLATNDFLNRALRGYLEILEAYIMPTN